MSFKFLGLSDALLAAVKDAGYSEPTPIQKQAIPAVLQGRNVMGIAQTGTGKTAGFTLPMIDILAEGRAKARMSRTLILEPTRELAAQVADSFKKYGKNHKLSMALLIGGVSFEEQEKLLDRGVDVLIATPGRLLDHFGRGKLMLTGVEVFVIDEADRMLDMGFIPDVEKIWSLMPQNPQTLFFSATMAPEIKRLTDKFLKDPKIIEVARPSTTAETVTQEAVSVSPRGKMGALKKILDDKTVKNAIIFCNRKRDVSSVYNGLKKAGIDARQLHGDMAQPDRMEVLGSFKDESFHVLVASDVAARGLDIPAVSHVINYDVPVNAEDYVHRIGRTGRAGRKGTAIMLVTKGDDKALMAIEKLTNQKISMDGDNKSAPASASAKAKDQKSPEKKADKKESPRQSEEKPQQDKKAQKPPVKQNHNKSGNQGKTVVGMGDHVPAFLMQSTKK